MMHEHELNSHLKRLGDLKRDMLPLQFYFYVEFIYFFVDFSHLVINFDDCLHFLTKKRPPRASLGFLGPPEASYGSGTVENRL